VPNFRERDEYWCNVDRAKMQELNRKARETGDWLKAAKELIPDYLDAIEPFARADAQFMWPTTGESRILDAGSMWGALTIPAAQNCRDIFAIDKTLETLVFLKIRAEQMGFRNIHVIASPLKKLPFPNDYFDLVILNGVLEWVAFDQDVILEIHWGKKRTDKVAYAESPRKMQLAVLNELRRVLKPGGHLYLGIENRFGYQYLAGQPDDHVNIKYVSLLPRFIANAITKWKLDCEYRTYTYSLPGYRSLLSESGFQKAGFYGAFPHYIQPSEIIPLNLVKHWKERVLPMGSSNAPRYLKMLAKMFPRALLKYVSPSFIIVAKKEEGENRSEARIVQLLRKSGLLRDSAPLDIRVVKSGGRPGNYNTANFLVHDKNDIKPAYFCKICRDNRYTDILKDEAKNLKVANLLLMNTDLNSSIPRLLYFGTIDNMTFMVSQFIEGTPSGFSPSIGFTKKNLAKLDESVQLGIKFLVKFQKYTQVREVEASHLLSVIEKQKEKLNKMGQLTAEVDSRIKELTGGLMALKGASIPLCAVHGDFDFYYNILFDRNGVRTVDFEHFEREGLPFLDLATLIFNPILISYKPLKSGISLSSFIDKHNLMVYIHNWMYLYARLSGVSEHLLQYFAQIAALEQQTKEYPYYRDPNTYPMYAPEAFTGLLSLKIQL
jgi:SAM-dependent methyltransferase